MNQTWRMMLINYINIALKKSIGHTKVLFGLYSLLRSPLHWKLQFNIILAFKTTGTQTPTSKVWGTCQKFWKEPWEVPKSCFVDVTWNFSALWDTKTTYSFQLSTKKVPKRLFLPLKGMMSTSILFKGVSPSLKHLLAPQI